ncbi:TIGR03013 family XrtA/PEP-CTERM system glycosyltransferase [Desulfogranum mediterraneum]|uniref:TIGR03013 family XrtA/PEP-CTERM system glycosyltransferase n=1 Tax=Desulfogranum mediterraneum TaxID=160661 RepID=UPI0004184249|nr:TIGR03013 family XrtA/PEP-CTERM system glycosyltransferase [Desulfogranum mediterraneum]
MPTFLNKYYPVRKILFFLGESLLIFTTFLCVTLAATGWRIFVLDLLQVSIRATVVTIIFQITLYLFDLYDLKKTPEATADTAVRMVQSFGVGCVILGLIYYLLPSLIISTKIFWWAYVIVCGVLLAWRALYYIILKNKYFTKEIVIVGTGEMAAKIHQEMCADQECGFNLLAFVLGSRQPSFQLEGIPLLPDLAALEQQQFAHRIKHIVVALDNRRGTMPIPELLEHKLQQMGIEDGIAFYEGLTGKLLVENVNPAWLIFSDGFACGWLTALLKRLMDITMAILVLVCSLPFCLLTALLIKLESPGPIFYRQERVGLRGRNFQVIKFRSMRNDAEKNGAVWASKDDARVTRVGGFIRKVRIDEIPQIWNVIKGEMSFVGPRPERPVFVEQLLRSIPYYSLRHFAKPGLTGWAQVCYPYGASELDALRKLEYDLYYIKNQSIFLDLLIIFRTVKTVLFRKGSR